MKAVGKLKDTIQRESVKNISVKKEEDENTILFEGHPRGATGFQRAMTLIDSTFDSSVIKSVVRDQQSSNATINMNTFQITSPQPKFSLGTEDTRMSL